jgi:hypothetical protein
MQNNRLLLRLTLVIATGVPFFTVRLFLGEQLVEAVMAMSFILMSLFWLLFLDEGLQVTRR